MESNKFTDFKGLIYFSDDQHNLLTMCKVIKVNNYYVNANKYAKIKIINNNKIKVNNEETNQGEQGKQNNKKELKIVIIKRDDVKFTECHRMEQILKLNSEYFITSLCKKMHGKKEKYIYDLIDSNNITINNMLSNAFLEDLLINYDFHELIGSPIIQIKTLNIRTHKASKSKFMDIVISLNKNEEILKEKKEINEQNLILKETENNLDYDIKQKNKKYFVMEQKKFILDVINNPNETQKEIMKNNLQKVIKYKTIHDNLHHVYEYLKQYINDEIKKENIIKIIDIDYLSNDVMKCYNEYEFIKNDALVHILNNVNDE